MARGYGWGAAFIDGMDAADRHMTSAKNREAADLAVKEKTAKMADDDRVRSLEAGRREALLNAQKPVQAEDGTTTQRRPFEVYSEAAKARLDAGDADGYEAYSSKADAHKAKWYTDEFGAAYRSGDKARALSLLNDFPNGIKYDLQPGENGKLVGIAYGPDAKVIGQVPFDDDKSFWDFTARMADPASVFAKLKDQRKAEQDARKTDADIEQSKAAAAASTSTATLNTERTAGERVTNELLRKYGPQKEQAEIGRIGAQARAAQGSAAAGFANASESKAGARLKDKQAEALPDKDEAKTDRTAMGIAQMAARMASEHNKLNQYSPENQKTAEDFMGQAEANFARGREAAKPGYGFARKPSVVPGQQAPGVPAQKDYSSLWK